MHALTLPASLLPNPSEGSPQGATVAAETPDLLALFEEALGLAVTTNPPPQPAQKLAVPLTESGLQPTQLQQTAPLKTGILTQTPRLGGLPSELVIQPPMVSAPEGQIPLRLASAAPIAPVVTEGTAHANLAQTAATFPQLTEQQAATVEQPFVKPQGLRADTAQDTPVTISSRSAAPGQALLEASLPGDDVLDAPFPVKLKTGTTPFVTQEPIALQTRAQPMVTETPTAPVLVAAESPTPTGQVEVVRTVTTPHAALEPQAMAQIRDTIRAGTRTGTIEVHLDPPELGRVLIELDVSRQGQVKAVISASEGDTLDLLRRHADTLAGDLHDSGFGDVELDWQQPGQSSDDPAQPWLADQSTTLAHNKTAVSRHDGAIDLQL